MTSCLFISCSAVLPTNSSVPIENVVVAESGDDSDDEWDYIKGADNQKADQERETPVKLETEQSDKESLKEANIDAAATAAVADDDNEAAAAGTIEEDAIITSPTPPTAPLGEPDFINQQSHAIAQALAEPEEACSEVSGIQFVFLIIN